MCCLVTFIAGNQPSFLILLTIYYYAAYTQQLREGGRLVFMFECVVDTGWQWCVLAVLTLGRGGIMTSGSPPQIHCIHFNLKRWSVVLVSEHFTWWLTLSLWLKRK